MNLLQVLNEIHRALGELRHEIGKIQGELVEIRRLSYRVSMLEQCQSWLKGGWAMLAAACGYLFHGFYAIDVRSEERFERNQACYLAVGWPHGA